MTDDTDPRPRYAAALAWVRGLVAAVPPERLGNPTPCADYDVRTLLGHLLATVYKVGVVAEDRHPDTVPHVVTAVPDDGWAAALDEAAGNVRAAWADDDLLDRPLPVPWGRVPGRIAIWGFTNEVLVHGWDLAVATGQDPEADPALVDVVFALMTRALPADARDGLPFSPVVASAPDAQPTERLANWSGHARLRLI